MVDLGFVRNIARVRLNWETAFGQSYSIQLSTNNTAWTSVYTTTNGPGSINDLATRQWSLCADVQHTTRDGLRKFTLGI
jgi:hypothetical protein